MMFSILVYASVALQALAVLMVQVMPFSSILHTAVSFSTLQAFTTPEWIGHDVRNYKWGGFDGSIQNSGTTGLTRVLQAVSLYDSILMG
ncbi:hypothetical protein FRC03_008534 [Tulasnella sp. 419]|nr:hypothetical protein FRC03_008534 [Tulasnella sp. 419]